MQKQQSWSRKLRIGLLSVGIGMGLSMNLSAQTTAEDVKTFTLKNGMEFMVLEDDSIPNANMYLFWKVGSRNEVPGITGLSHFFEHMMFNGAKKYGPKQFDRVMEANGGANNAYTTEDVTVYTDWFPASALETIFDLESDRIAHLKIDEKMVESERGVVTSERSTGLENSNVRLMMMELKGIAFRAHPYSWPVIGHQSDIDNWSIEDLRDYHRRYYAPNNGLVVVAGDVKAEEVERLAKKYLGDIPAQPEPRKIHTVEPEQKGERRAYVQKESVSSPNIMMGFHVPNTRHKDYYALDMVESLLSGDDSARLTRALVDQKQLATNVWAYYPQSIDPNIFYIFATAAEGVTVEKLEHGIIEEINKLRNELVSDRELQKVKNQAQVGLYHTLATINGKADTLGTYQIYFGDYKKMFDASKDMAKVTAEDVKRVMNSYFRKANRSVVVLDKHADSIEGDK
ncbi:pitrilysin family protein [uncultured Pseudoteredinibacter sp.]|uniref:M16 family metallopeptidase n=1 Tax=uncultured Pseudoteredinibacter sp. TaxID=1641701 RepID=UPI002631F86A|nr:pitrilysin family protein [uncultured Pseudoteredinibacter sp.]